MDTSGGFVQKGIIGFVVFVIALAVIPMLWLSFNNLHMLTDSHCNHSGKRFTAVNTAANWSGTEFAVGQDTSREANSKGLRPCKILATGTDATYEHDGDTVYLPDGTTATVTGFDSDSDAATYAWVGQLNRGLWEDATQIISAQGQINGLVIAVLPLAVVIGGLGAAGMWMMGRGRAMMGGS